jgi:hypothetical protein
MKYTLISEEHGPVDLITVGNIVNHIPLDDPANRHYQEVLDAIIEQGADCFEGDIPEDLQEAADAKHFNQQLTDYSVAVARLAQYIVADGREEVTEKQPTGEKVWNEETEKTEDVMRDVIIVTEIKPVDSSVTRLVYSNDSSEKPTEETIENPLITKDKKERAEAQAVVDATPSKVVDAYNAL